MVIARSSNLLGKVNILVMVSFVVSTALALDGSGTQEDPWRIQSLEDFNDFAADANYWAGFTRLETDVNLAGMVFERAVIAWDVNDAEDGFQGTAFTGVFDGNDHKIMNLTINGGFNDLLGLFSYIEEDSQIRYLGLEGSFVSGDNYVGSLVGWSYYGGISFCYSIGEVIGTDSVGGLLGVNEYGNVSNCYSTGSVAGTSYYVGGLVGFNRGKVSKCYSSGNVVGIYDVGGLVGGNVGGNISNCHSNCSVSGKDVAGGLVGGNNNTGNVSNCYSTGSVAVTGYWAGGLMGWHTGFVSDCYSKCDVSGYEWVGGLVGQNGWIDIFHGKEYPGYIFNCYSIGSVQGDSSIGGLVGYSELGNPESSFWDMDTSGQEESDGGIGLPTSQLYQQSTFSGWDFINVWNIGENQTYPYLRTYLAGDINKDGIVNFLDLSITANQWLEGDKTDE